MKRRVVITGTGYFSAIGNNISDVIDNIKNDNINESSISLERDVKVRVVDAFNVKDFTGRDKKVKYLNRGAQFGVAAALKAFVNSGIDKNIEKAGLITSFGPNLDIGGEINSVSNGTISKKDLNALWLLRFLPNTATSVIASRTGFHGENSTVSTACASSLNAIGEAFRKIKDGYLDVALTGGGDSRVSYGGLLAYEMAGALSKSNIHRPFDHERDGFISGEGGAFLMLEELSHAQKRSANIFAEVKGFSLSLDNTSLTAPDPTGIYAERSMRNALSEANITPSSVDLISSHGTGTNLNDDVEADLIKRVYGEQSKAISIKSWSGHLSTACGALETSLSIDFMRSSFIPKIRGLKNPISDINFNLKNTDESIETVALQNFGFGGQNCALIIKKWNE
ncbi:MAG: beta-ketoacyl-[acyl-carrier-protein] synthase family protein [Desulfobacterales bacterium]|nr:beta-ketoacyl-[acyl-carrier-protein] synthase family protein [Desulfobacterales bacterium]MCP4162863.1 beta-ketoacyl-[acyl-carrier-protein] synthase family protein [Deltaproteobacteria bacterium]